MKKKSQSRIRKHREKRQERRVVLAESEQIPAVMVNVPALPASDPLPPFSPSMKIYEACRPSPLKVAISCLQRYALEIALNIVILSLFAFLGMVNYLYLTNGG